MSNDAAAIAAIAKAAASADSGEAKDVSDLLNSLAKARDQVNKPPQSAQNWAGYSTGPSGVYGQYASLGVAGVGSGVAQLLAPSFSAITADPTGISILGKKVFDFPIPNYVDAWIEKSPKLKAFVDKHTLEDPAITSLKGDVGALQKEVGVGVVSRLRTDVGRFGDKIYNGPESLVHKTGALEDKVEMIQTAVRELPAQLKAAGDGSLTKGGNRGVASNTAELDALSAAVQELADRLGA